MQFGSVLLYTGWAQKPSNKVVSNSFVFYSSNLQQKRKKKQSIWIKNNERLADNENADAVLNGTTINELIEDQKARYMEPQKKMLMHKFTNLTIGLTSTIKIVISLSKKKKNLWNSSQRKLTLIIWILHEEEMILLLVRYVNIFLRVFFNLLFSWHN